MEDEGGGDGWVSELWVRLRAGGENERGVGNIGDNGTSWDKGRHTLGVWSHRYGSEPGSFP